MHGMTWLAILLGVSMSLPIAADPPDEEFPEGPGQEEEVLPGSDEEAMAEEDVDPLALLESIHSRMKDAEERLAKIGAVEAKEFQQKAIQELDRLFRGSREQQQMAIEEIEKLIRSAREGQGESSSGRPEKRDPQERPEGQEPTSKSNDPADRVYVPPGADERGLEERRGSLGDRWGDLPPRFRDELSQAEDEFRSAQGEYGQRLRNYSSAIGSVD